MTGLAREAVIETAIVGDNNRIALVSCRTDDNVWWEVRTPELDMDFPTIDQAIEAFEDEVINWEGEPDYTVNQEAAYAAFLEQMEA